MVMEYEEGGDLHNYLQMQFTKLKWRRGYRERRGILNILWQIAKGYLYLKYICI